MSLYIVFPPCERLVFVVSPRGALLLCPGIAGVNHPDSGCDADRSRRRAVAAGLHRAEVPTVVKGPKHRKLGDGTAGGSAGRQAMNRKSKDRNVVLEKPRRLEDAPQRFDTPSWLASRPATDQDAPGQAAPGGATAKVPAGIPQQAAPVHDNAATMARTGIPREARWKARHRVRTFFALLMVPLLA